MYHVYILRSKKNNKFYVGYSENYTRRADEHNSGKVKSTKNNRPWEIYYCEKYLNERDAIKREKQIKLWKSRKSIKRLKFLNKNRGSSIL